MGAVQGMGGPWGASGTWECSPCPGVRSPAAGGRAGRLPRPPVHCALGPAEGHAASCDSSLRSCPHVCGFLHVLQEQVYHGSGKGRLYLCISRNYELL